MSDRYFQTLSADLTDAQFFKTLDRLRLSYLRRKRGWTGGERVVRRVGASIEFAGHRSYDPGDDLRYLDWHLLARLDEPYIKTYQEQEYYYVHIILDASASMFGMREGRKFQVAKDMAFALSYLTLINDDRLMLVRIPDSTDLPYRTASRAFLLGRHQMPAVNRFMSHVHADGLSSFETGLARYIHTDRRHLDRAVLLSDFQQPVAQITNQLSQFLSANCQLTIIRLIDPEERTFEPDRMQVRVKDLENGEERLLTLDENNKKQYEQLFNEHRAALMAFCTHHGISYIECDTSQKWYDPSYEDALLHQLIQNHIFQA